MPIISKKNIKAYNNLAIKQQSLSIHLFVYY